MEYYLAIKKNKALYAITCMNLENTMLRERMGEKRIMAKGCEGSFQVMKIL